MQNRSLRVFINTTVSEIHNKASVVHKKQTDRVAIIFKVKNIGQNDTCPCERFVALVEGTVVSPHYHDSYTIILLHEPEEVVSPSLVEWIKASNHSHRVMILPTPALSADKSKNCPFCIRFPQITSCAFQSLLAA